MKQKLKDLKREFSMMLWARYCGTMLSEGLYLLKRYGWWRNGRQS